MQVSKLPKSQFLKFLKGQNYSFKQFCHAKFRNSAKILYVIANQQTFIFLINGFFTNSKIRKYQLRFFIKSFRHSEFKTRIKIFLLKAWTLSPWLIVNWLLFWVWRHFFIRSLFLDFQGDPHPSWDGQSFHKNQDS